MNNMEFTMLDIFKNIMQAYYVYRKLDYGILELGISLFE